MVEPTVFDGPSDEGLLIGRQLDVHDANGRVCGSRLSRIGRESSRGCFQSSPTPQDFHAPAGVAVIGRVASATRHALSTSVSP